MEVGKVGGGSKDREHLHGGLQFRIGHERQIDQALGRASIEGLQDCLVFGPDLLEGRVCRQVNAEQVQARERAGHGLGIFRLHGVEQNLDLVTAAWSTFDAARANNSAVSCSAFSKLPLRYSHSARSSPRLKVNSYRLPQSLSSNSAMPAEKYARADAYAAD